MTLRRRRVVLCNYVNSRGRVSAAIIEATVALRHAILAALLEGEASGYELSKRFDMTVANYWSATPQQLYRELERLEGDGLLDVYVVQQERRPNKRVFSMTEAGHEELIAFTAGATRPPALRDELLVKVAASDVTDPDAVRTVIEERLEYARGKLALFERKRKGVLAGRTEEEFLREGERIGPYLTLMRGLSYERDTLRWGKRALEALAERAAARS